MKKTLLSMAVIGGLFSGAYADDLSDLKSQIKSLTKKVKSLEKKQKRLKKSVAKVKAHDAFDNIKWDVDFRTSFDNLHYKTVSGETASNNDLYTNRLWLGMGYQVTPEMIFKGQLSFNKAFGADGNVNPTQKNPARGRGFDAFDWIVNESLTDDTLKVREAFWLWKPTIGGYSTSFSVGRRPATNGYLINLRDDDKAKSPQGHIINMEFDGASATLQLGNVLPGMYVKLCAGRGLTNANTKLDQAGFDYATDGDDLDNTDLIGVLAKLYDDGQYGAMMTLFRAKSVPGYDASSVTPVLKTLGDIDGAALSFKVQGIGDEINDFLDDTIVFASFAMSQTRPNGTRMLGTETTKSGYSYWLGAQVPNATGGKFGIEYNHGSEYWRPFTYGEDTMIGSKMAVRGNAYEAYWTQPIIQKDGKDVFSMQVRYTYLDYDYSGSNAFFGDAGAPISLDDSAALAKAQIDPVETAQDLRIYFRYRY